MAEQQLEQIEGTVEDIIYENTDNGYMVFEVSGGGVVTVVCGIVGELHAGESVVCRGRYENHATYGRQFHAQECETDMPKDLEAVYAFLASRSLPYIGAKTADKIIDLFGAQALEVIANDPARLTQVPGISADKADRVNKETVSLEPVEHKYDVATLKELIREHVEATGSPRGKEILDNFSEFLPKFKKVLPYDYDRMLRVIASVEERGLDGEQAQIEAFYTVQKKK